MASTTAQSRTWDAAVLPRRGGLTAPSGWPEHWPLTVLLLGFPIWWALGLAAVMPLIVAVPMLLQLLRRHPVRVPVGFGWWLLFLGCVVLSGALLFVDAPNAVPGGGLSRLAVFGFRLIWYLACTIVLLWVINLDETSLPTRRVVSLLSWMFLVTVAGGLLGVLVPGLQFTSPVEAVLPAALRSNEFVRTLVHPVSAAVQSILGSASPRPVAPFTFPNSWGANLSMFLPFFLLRWLGRGAGWRRTAAPFVLALAAIPIVLSLNRGLWLSLALGIVYYVVRLVLTGRLVAIVGAVLVVVVAGSIFLVSPLGQMVGNRIETPHSNERRGELLTDTVVSAAVGSPVLGFGSTRDVQGSFASIAGGSTPDCPACSVPPLGTQGQIWLVIFAQGFVGLVTFLGFYFSQFVQHWRSRTPIEVVGVCLLLFFALQLFVYDTLGMPMYTLMIAIGLMHRERLRVFSPTLESIVERLRRAGRLILVLGIAGGAAGAVIAWRWAPVYDATTSVMLAPSPLYLDPTSEEGPKEITVDTEASMVFSEEAISRVRRELDLPVAPDVRESIRVTAPPNSRVLDITSSAEDPAVAEAIADAAAGAYLAVRTDYLGQRRLQVRDELEQQLDSVIGRGLVVKRSADDFEDDGDTRTPLLAEDELRDALSSLSLVSTESGQVLRPAVARAERKQAEIPVVSGMLLGALGALAIMSWRDAGADRRRRSARLEPTPPPRKGARAEA